MNEGNKTRLHIHVLHVHIGQDPPIFQHVGVFSSVMTRNPEFMEYYMHALNFQSDGQLILFNPQEFFEYSSAKHLR